MFVYCGNNPIARLDVSGDLWAAVLGGLAVQYASDVVTNVMSGKRGIEAFIPTSSLATYTAAAVTALIPGGSLFKAAVRSTVAETIQWVDNTLNGRGKNNNLLVSATKVAVNTFVDFSSGKVLDATFGKLGTHDFSTYAQGEVLHRHTSTLKRAYNSMQRSNIIGRAAGKALTKVYQSFINAASNMYLSKK